MPTYGFNLNVEAATHNSLTISVTNLVGTSGATFAVAAELSGTVVASTTVTTGTAGESVNAILTGLSPSTTYTITGKIDDITEAASITASTTASSSDPRIATESQWQDLATRVKAKADSSDVPTITMTSTDPGEGSPLAANHYVAVYSSMGSLLDMFYPVGSYYETSDTTFNPNTAWGGTWVEDSAGNVTVAYSSGDTDFGTVGGTGGNKVGYTAIRLGKGQVGFQSISTAAYNDRVLVANVPTTSSSNNNEYASTIQPYVVVKRWHRTA